MFSPDIFPGKLFQHRLCNLPQDWQGANEAVEHLEHLEAAGGGGGGVNEAKSEVHNYF